MTTETKKLAMLSGTLCVLATAGLCGMWYMVARVDARYREELHTHATQRAVEERVKSVNKFLAETAQDRDALTQYMLTEDSVAVFLSRIEGLAKSLGMKAETKSLAVKPIIDISIPKDKKSPAGKESETFEYLTLEVRTAGSFPAVMKMLSLLELLPYQTQVRSVAIEHVGEIETTDMWQGTYQLYVTKYQ